MVAWFQMYTVLLSITRLSSCYLVPGSRKSILGGYVVAIGTRNIVENQRPPPCGLFFPILWPRLLVCPPTVCPSNISSLKPEPCSLQAIPTPTQIFRKLLASWLQFFLSITHCWLIIPSNLGFCSPNCNIISSVEQVKKNFLKSWQDG